ncbi:MAG: transketolase C-terminal domain-containing protein [Minisyncoccia bacterium]
MKTLRVGGMDYGQIRIDNMISKFLNKKIFDKDVEQVPIRHGFGEGLVIAGEKDKNVVVLCADLTESAQAIFFKEKFPERFIEIGVAEQNLAGVASGISATGKIPFITSYAMFSPGRNWEQIRTTIAYNNRPVKIAGSHTGVSVGPDGGTHQALEDIAIMRTMPRMVVISPCDAIEARKATEESAKNGTPVYIRLAREKTPIITTEDTPFSIGKAQIFYESESPLVAIVATGALVHKALQVAHNLEKENIGTIIVNLATIKPLDEKTILEVAKKAGAVVTVEEHQVMGGMGSAVAEFLSQNYPVPIEFVGVNDEFGQSGTPEELIEHYGLGINGIDRAVKKVLKKK